VLIMDVDVVVLRNPFNYFTDIPACDVAITTDTTPPRITTDNAGRWSESTDTADTTVWINTGFMLWRPSNSTKELLEDFALPKYRIPGMDDQFEFNAYLNGRLRDTPDQANLHFTQRMKICSTMGGLRMHNLSPWLFGSQRHMFEFGLPGSAALAPYVIHYNWLSGFDAKKIKMVADGMWMG
jgi:Nucleotide-diphospho-sugar transferase